MLGTAWQQLLPIALHYVILAFLLIVIYKAYRLMLVDINGRFGIKKLARLVWKEADEPHFRRLNGNITIGRGPQNSIIINDEAASYEHAMVAEYPDGYMLSDLHSTNGTFLNGQKMLEPRLLRKGDKITIGNTVLAYKLDR